MKNAIYSLLFSTLIVPALMVAAPPKADKVERNQSDWPIIADEPEVLPAPVFDTEHKPGCPDYVEPIEAPILEEGLKGYLDAKQQAEGVGATYESNASIAEEAKALRKLADEIRSIAAKVQADADRAKQAADDARKNSEGMKSYVPPVADVQALTEARVIELIDQRIKELKIECKCVTTGKVATRSVPVVVDNRGVANFDVRAGEVLVGYEDVVTGQWVSVNRNAMAPVTGVANTVYSYSTPTTEYREIKPATRTAPVRAAVRFNPLPQGWMQPGPVSVFGNASKTCRMVNGVRVCN